MRIVQAVGWYFPNNAGGTEVYVDELSRRLLTLGHEVLIAAPEPNGATERSYRHHGVQVYRYPIPLKATRDEAQGRSVVRGASRFHDWLARTRPDVVHTHTFVTGLGVPELRAVRQAGARSIVTTHSAALGFTCQRGSLMRWGRRLCDGRVGTVKCGACAAHHAGLPRGVADAVALIPPPVGDLVRRLPGPVGTGLGMTALIAHNRRLQREMFDLVDRFVVLTDYARQVLLANGAPADQVSLNRLGVRFPRRPERASAARPTLTIAYLGRFDPIKGVEDFARAIGAVPRSAHIHFEFAGPVRNKADLAIQTRVKRLVGADAWVTFRGELDAAGVQALLERIDLLCCPSRVIEGGPTVALEAQAAGVPVVGSDIPGLSEIVRDGVNGRLVSPGDWRALARLFRDLAEDRSRLDTWRQALGPVRTMDDVTQDYLELYRQ